MSYFAGPNLERKIREYDLEDLDKKLQGIVNSTGTWPGALGLAAEPAQLETTRIILYSMLHKYGLKDEFVVKMRPGQKMVVIDLKAGSGQKKRTGGSQLLSPDGTLAPSQGIETLDEDLSEIFSVPIEEGEFK